MNDTNNTPAPDLSDWETVASLASQLNERGTVLSGHAVRHLIAHAECNGLAPHVRRLGRKILISRSGFATWLATRPSFPPTASRVR